MGRRERAVIGGLLTGLGEGLVNRDRDRRKEEQERRKEIIARLKEDRQFKQQSGLLASTQVDESGNVIGITRSGQSSKLGFKARPNANASQSGMSAGDKRTLDAAAAIYTTKDLAGEKTDWAKVATHLRKQGHADLAKLVDLDKSTSTIDVNSDQYIEAQRMADEWIDEQTTVLGRDKTELSEYGGNRAQARQAKTQEFYKELTGTDQPSGGTKPAKSGTKLLESGTKPAGSGTEKDPYRAFSQADVDWFKANAAAGTIIEVDGKLYKK